MKLFSTSLIVSLVACLLMGCASTYSWRRALVPADVRKVSVPTFRNETTVSELGALAARQILREFQREGTFEIQTQENAIVEVQGVLKSATTKLTATDRRSGSQRSAYQFAVVAEVSVIDKRSRRVLVNNKKFTATTFLTSGMDLSTSKRNASARAMENLAQQVVDCVLGIKW